MAASSTFSMEAWTLEFELHVDTILLLADKGFNSFKSLKRLSQDILKKEFSKSINPGQFVLLCDAVESLRESAADGVAKQVRSPAVEQRQHNLDTGTTLTPHDIQRLFGEPAPGVSTTPPSQATPGNATIFDPLTFGTVSMPTKKCRDIRDYVSGGYNGSGENDDPLETITFGSKQISLTESKLPLEKLKLAQYMEGSLKILRAMVTEDEADINKVLNYVTYVTKIAMFAQVFQWEAVLKYDVEYRKSQAALGFAWGADSPYLMHLYLQPSVTPRAAAQRVRPTAPRNLSKNRHEPATGKIICRKFNQPGGCDLRGCKYAHACITCYRNHPDCSYTSMPDAPST